MLNDFLNWVNELKIELKEKGIETEEINIVDSTDNPSITVYHYSPEKFMGLITMWETKYAHIEILDYSSRNIMINEHLQLEDSTDFYKMFNRYLTILSS